MKFPKTERQMKLETRNRNNQNEYAKGLLWEMPHMLSLREKKKKTNHQSQDYADAIYV